MIQNIFHKIVFGSLLLLGLCLPRKARPGGAKRLAIFRSDAIGDFILFSPALKYLRENYHNYRITLILRKEVSPLAEGCPYVDEIIAFDNKKYLWNLFYRLNFLRRLAQAGFSISVNPVYSRDSIGDEMVLWTRAAQKIGWDAEAVNQSAAALRRRQHIYTRLLRSNSRIPELQRNRGVLELLHIRVDDFKPEFWITEDDRARAGNLLPNDVADAKHLIAILPGAASEMRKWGAAKFNLLMKRITEFDKRAFFLILGGPNESEGLSPPNDQGEANFLDLCGKTTLRELPSLFARCQAVVGNETGTLHLAMAAGAPTVCILGGGQFGRFMPYGDPQRNRFVYKKLHCFNCNWQCIYPFPECIRSIGVDEVFSELSICSQS